ncbi:HEAT repeats [Paenibacillus sp. 1_12]|uniref:HEAT repeat domain-containing protein n=1 Tax=Paenibacillus sp. 1_12 TaxID=1566278 RepID=UPI0008E093B9|nr:HEAT repeat domain-containing protein [Paenibacillus sp. 1_12]SFM37283.1 HEAT repeats [Paenibacillus sp. 1_12]
MNNVEVQSELPPNYEELVKSANRTANWKERLDAVEELGQWNNSQIISVLTRIMNSDTVYKVQEAAFRKLQAFGEEVQLPSQKKGDLIKGAAKIFVRIKKSLPEGHTYEQFKEKLNKMRSDVYDTYEGEKGADFDTWLEQTWSSITKK